MECPLWHVWVTPRGLNHESVMFKMDWGRDESANLPNWEPGAWLQRMLYNERERRVGYNFTCFLFPNWTWAYIHLCLTNDFQLKSRSLIYRPKVSLQVRSLLCTVVEPQRHYSTSVNCNLYSWGAPAVYFRCRELMCIQSKCRCLWVPIGLRGRLLQMMWVLDV